MRPWTSTTPSARAGRTRRSSPSPCRARRSRSCSTWPGSRPNHHLTQPWRFRALGPESLARLKEAAGPTEAVKLDRAPTLVVASARLTGAQQQDEEDVCATAAAIYAVLLGAHARGLASYWRTPAVLRTRAGRAAAGIPDGERVLGLIHLGRPRTEPDGRDRAPVESYLSFLD